MENEQTFSIILNLYIYSLDSIKKASYKFTEMCSIFLDDLDKDNNTVKVTFTILIDKYKCDREKILNDFRNELLDQDLRERISSETEAVRNLILAQAFSKTSLLDE